MVQARLLGATSWGEAPLEEVVPPPARHGLLRVCLLVALDGLDRPLGDEQETMVGRPTEFG